jgi:hypothetical protein
VSKAELRARKRLLTFAGRLRRLVKDIDAIPASVRKQYEQGLRLSIVMGVGPHPPELESRSYWDQLLVLRRAAEVVIWMASEQRSPSKGGRPIAAARDLFAFRVAVILRLRGVPLAVSCNGAFARALRIVARGLFDLPKPKNMIPVVRNIIRVVPNSREELDFYFNQPTFFSQGPLGD